MKRYLAVFAILAAVLALGPASVQAMDESDIALTTTNQALNVISNQVTTISAQTGGTRTFDLTIENTSTAKLYVTFDGSTPTTTRGLVLYPPQTVYNIAYSGTNNDVAVTNTWTETARSVIAIKYPQTAIKILPDPSIGATTGKVQTVERTWTKYP